MRARLEPVAKVNGLTDCEALLHKLVSTPYGTLHKKSLEAMATHETSFFRDAHPFEIIRNKILPDLISARQDVRRLNIWCAAASTGQEPYSLAMLLQDFETQLASWSVRILATDVSDFALAAARSGRYSSIDAHRGLTSEQRTRYFTLTANGQYQLCGDIMQKVEFQSLNLIAPWQNLPRFDLILIRNVLIYFNRQHRDLVFKKINLQLADEKSYLMLGSSESIISDPTYRTVRTNQGSIYQKTASFV